MIIIPARLNSTRFPRKMLADVLGYPMVVKSAKVAQEVDDVVVATDSEEISEICKKHTIPSVMTKTSHLSGTDRCAEAARILNLGDNEVIINMQGDEPFLESKILEALYQMMSVGDHFIGTCIQEIDIKDAEDPNIVKVVLDAEKCALYFSRSMIPFQREKEDGCVKYYGHLGLYAFKNKNLQEFCLLPKSPLEEIEKLEQLRALWNQKKIQTLLVQTRSIGIDTPQDYLRAIEFFKEEQNDRN